MPIYIAGRRGGPIGWMIYLPGLILIATGTLVVLVPEILIVAIASLFILAGIAALGWARQLRRDTTRHI